MTSKFSNRALAVCSSIALAGMLAACGGGGSGGPGDEGGPTGIAQGYGPGNPAGCPHATQDDTWFNKRLGCLAAGQKFVLVSGGATGDAADRAYLVNQKVLDLSLVDVLGTDVARYFKYGICVRNAPANLSGTALANDLATAIGLNAGVSARAFYPPSVSGSTMSLGGSADTPVIQTTCSVSLHPVIVNYQTGLVETVNPAALAALTVYDR